MRVCVCVVTVRLQPRCRRIVHNYVEDLHMGVADRGTEVPGAD